MSSTVKRDSLGRFVKGMIPHNKVGLKKKCIKCGKYFSIKPSHFNNRKYCSMECAYPIKDKKQLAKRKYHREYNKKYRLGIKSPLKAKVRTCQYCGKKYTYKQSAGTKFCSVECCYKGKDYNLEGLKLGRVLGNIAQAEGRETKIETKLYKTLKDFNIEFEKQKLINERFLVDAYVKDFNLVIEADGDYWHSLDRVRKRDKAKNAYLTKCGYEMLRIPEHIILDDNFNNFLKEKIYG